MAKRIAVKYVGTMYSRNRAMGAIPEGTEFKAVESLDSRSNVQGVLIRGSSLTKACKGAHKFKGKQYLFLIDDSDTPNAMEIIDG